MATKRPAPKLKVKEHVFMKSTETAPFCKQCQLSRANRVHVEPTDQTIPLFE